MIDIREYMGKEIRERRKQQDNMSQETLAEKANTTQAMISKIERGKAAPSFQLICDIAKALDCSPTDFCSPELGFTSEFILSSSDKALIMNILVRKRDMISKPIIDILLCPDRDASLDAFIPVLDQIGYTNLGECGKPGRYFLSKGNEENHTFYLHLCYEDHQVAMDQKLLQFIEQNDPSLAVMFADTAKKSSKMGEMLSGKTYLCDGKQFIPGIVVKVFQDGKVTVE